MARFLHICASSQGRLGAPSTPNHHHPRVYSQEQKMSCPTNPKPWPLKDCKPSCAQMSPQRIRNQVCIIGTQVSTLVSKAKSGALSGTEELEWRWWSKANIRLQLQRVSVIQMSLPSSFIFVWGMKRLEKTEPFDVMPHLTCADCETCVFGSKFESISNLQRLLRLARHKWVCESQSEKELIPATQPKCNTCHSKNGDIKVICEV